MNAWTDSRRIIITLAACAGMDACLCVKNGVLAKGKLEFSAGAFFVGSQRVHSSSVSSLTIESDLITIHLGSIA